MRRARTGSSQSLGGQILHVVQKLVDVRAPGGQVVPAVRAVAVVPGGGQVVVELVARAVDEPFLLVLLGERRGRERSRDHRPVRRNAERSSHEPVGRAGGADEGISSDDRPVARTIAERRSRSDSFCVPWPTRAYFSTSRSVETGMTSTMPRYFDSSTRSSRFSSGTSTRLMPESAAASTFAVTPPTGRTWPRTESDPVIATDWSTGTPSRALMTAVAIETEALSPSTPSDVPTNWMWISYREMSSPVYFLMSALTFWTASRAISPSFPVATTTPPFRVWAGVTSATIGRTMPENSAMPVCALIAARPFTTPTAEPSVENMWYSLRRST